MVGFCFIHPTLINLKKGTNQYNDLKPLVFVRQKQLNLVNLSIDFRCPTFDIVLTLISCLYIFQLHDSIYEMKMLSMSQEGVLAKEF
jgi:hypothetical protein